MVDTEIDRTVLLSDYFRAFETVSEGWIVMLVIAWGFPRWVVMLVSYMVRNRTLIFSFQGRKGGKIK